MTLSAVIVDDEQLARDELAYLLKNLGDVNVVAQGKNGLEAISLIKEHSPDLVFLDVQMPGLDGFGVIKKLLDKKIPLPKIVFATAFDQYAVKAFEVNAVDYLLKPFDKKRVAQSVQKARTQQEAEGLPAEKIDTLVRMLQAPKTQSSKILLKAVGRMFLVDQKEICYASIEDGVITVVTAGAVGHGGALQLPHLGGTTRQLGSRIVLARSPLLPGEHQSNSRSRALVQEFVPVAHGRQEAERDSSQPRSNQAAAGAFRSLSFPVLPGRSPLSTLSPRSNFRRCRCGRLCLAL